MLTLRDLSLSRGERPLVRRLNLDLREGEAVALEGANGVGKTTLLRAIAGLVKPDGGEILWSGQSLAPTERGRVLHWLGHLDGLKGQRTLRQEVHFQVDWVGGDGEAGLHAADELGLTPLLDLDVRRLSAGQRRRAALVRFLAVPRPLWLMDEPLAPLDARWRTVIGDAIQAHLSNGGALLAAVHDPLPVSARSVRLAGTGTTAR